MSTEQDVRQAVEDFYAAVTRCLNGDAEPVLALWARGPEATVMHPAGGRQAGWEEVRDAWEGWARALAGGEVRAAEVSVRLVTAEVAVVSAVERGRGTLGADTVEVDCRATLVLRREGRAWRPVHHHVDLIPRLRALIQAAALDLTDARIGASVDGGRPAAAQ
jgi:ketosteroid isomerase-like protein